MLHIIPKLLYVVISPMESCVETVSARHLHKTQTTKIQTLNPIEIK